MSKIVKVLEAHPGLCNHFRKHRTVFIQGYHNSSFTQIVEGNTGLGLIEFDDTQKLHQFSSNEEIYFLIQTDQPWFLPILFPSQHSVALTNKGVSIVADGKYKFQQFLPWSTIKEVHLINDHFVFDTSNGEVTIENHWIYRIEDKAHYRTDAEVIAKIMHLIAAQYDDTSH